MFSMTGVCAPGRFSRLLVAAGLLLPLVAALSPAVLAAEEDEEAGSTYARVRWLEDGLSIERPSEGEVLGAFANQPIIPGDRVWTGAGRAEIELADSSVLWLDEGTRLEVSSLADYDNRYERTNLLVLRHGALRVDNRDTGDADSVFQIDTEAGSIYLLSGGSFRIEADGSGTTVSSYSGVVEFSGEGGSVLVRSGQRSGVVLGAVPDEPRRFNTSRSDDFDRLHDDRLTAYAAGAQVPEAEAVPVEVRPYVRELSYYGSWTTIAPYGVVWRPAFASAWSPYTHGTWAWYPTGWVWVSYDPWGWAPYRYGRWDYAGNIGWFWVPGRVWSGAWVSFAVSTTHVGWCPLNYWNRPVFHDPWIAGVPAVPVARLDPRGWQFVPVGRFGARGVAIAASRIDHLPRGTEVVVTRSLPARPRAVATRTDPAPSLYEQVRRGRVALPAATSASGEPVSFRVQEQRRAAGPGAPRKASTPPRTRSNGPRNAPASAIANPQQMVAPAPRGAAPPPGAGAARPNAPPARAGTPQGQRGTHDQRARVPQGAAPPPAPAPQEANATRTRKSERPAPPGSSKRSDPAPGQAKRADPGPAQRPEPVPHDPAVGRLVGGMRPAPAAPLPVNSTTQARPAEPITPASEPEPEAGPQHGRGTSRSEAAREKHQGKAQGKAPGKPKDQSQGSGG